LKVILGYFGTTYIHLFYGPLDFVRDYLGEPIPEPIWILLKQETVSGSGISWATCKSALRPIQITMPAPNHSVFYRRHALPVAQPTASEHWEQPLVVICHSQKTINHSTVILLYYSSWLLFAIFLNRDWEQKNVQSYWHTDEDASHPSQP